MGRKHIAMFAVGVTAIASAFGASANAPHLGLKGALDQELIGLLPATGFKLRTGNCTDCVVAKQNLWYFKNELIAVPANDSVASTFDPGNDWRNEIRRWAATTASSQLAHPSLIWLGSSHILEDASFLDAQHVRTIDGNVLPLQFVPKLPTNRSYVNKATMHFFEGRQLRMRGTLANQNEQKAFVARTIWPTDFNLPVAELKHTPLGGASELAAFIREPIRDAKGLETRLLWERRPGQTRDWQQKPVIGLILNGAQGDDDESLGGHFAVATGRIGDKGEWSGWAVNNFYNLASINEKGIIAGTLPMDNYLMDLNSGQQYYRPSYMLVAVLNKDRTAVAFQGAVQRVFNHFYRHDFRYQHATANCAGISVDVFKALGWQIPQRGPTSPIKSLAAYTYVAATDASLASGRKIYDYLNEEQTRLLPAVAFDAAGLDLLDLASTKTPMRTLSRYEEQLRSDIEAILLVRIPQVPSSRPMGSAPVFSFDEFRARVPEDRAQWKTIPVEARSFPPSLFGPIVDDAPAPVPLPIVGIGTCGVLGIFALRRRKKKPKAAPGQTVPAPVS